jgi:hypothetical protein
LGLLGRFRGETAASQIGGGDHVSAELGRDFPIVGVVAGVLRGDFPRSKKLVR